MAEPGSLHMLKLSVGSDSIEALENWQRGHRTRPEGAYHQTRMKPRRAAELLDGGSIYWVIRGRIQARQRILAIEQETDSEGRPCAVLILRPRLVRTYPRAQRAFQGWRYLEARDAPKDLPENEAENGGIPPKMAAELRALGLL